MPLHKKPPKPTHVYIARNQCCGRCTGIVSDMKGDPKGTAEDVARFITSGRTINRVTWGDYAEKVSQELGFMLNCECAAGVEAEDTRQLSLF